MSAASLVSIRDARPSDEPVLADFNRAMALETERVELDPLTVAAGVKAVLNDATLGFYTVAETRGQTVAALLVTYEWSDWRNGLFWWVQSVYVHPQHRRRGIYHALYEHVKKRAEAGGGVCGIRLYVDAHNTRAQQTYRALGMRDSNYLVYEELM